MGDEATLRRARDAVVRRAWDEAHDALAEVDMATLGPADLVHRGTAAHLAGRSEDAFATFAHLHDRHRDAGRVDEAVRWAVWSAILHVLRGEVAQGGGWLGRASRVGGQAEDDAVATGYLLAPAGLQALGGGDPRAALTTFEQVLAVGERHGDADLTVLGLLGRGQALVAMGQAGPGLARLDEAMVAVTRPGVSPILAGIVYCAVVLTCRMVFDLRRAHEWTMVLSRWCRDQQGLQPYRGQCLVHRSELLALRGDWAAAMTEVERACVHLEATPGDPVMGMARYQQGELLRLHGAFDRAEAAYRAANEHGHSPQPGLALLRLAQGRSEDAAAAIRREIDEAAGDRVRRARVLGASVEVLVAVDDLEGAGDAVDALEALAADVDSTYLAAVAAEGRGLVLLARDQPSGACAALRRAWTAWQRLDAPYDAARARVPLARACRRLGDHDAAEMELVAARRVFEELGALPALGWVDEVAGRDNDTAPGGLTPREVEVLRVVATGATNREVADALVISERTVARHLSNMFTKLDLGTRAAATAWAYEHGLV